MVYEVVEADVDKFASARWTGAVGHFYGGGLIEEKPVRLDVWDTVADEESWQRCDFLSSSR